MTHDTLALVEGPAVNPSTLHEGVHRIVESQPTAVALSTTSEGWTYAQLWHAAQCWSGLLRDCGVVEGDVIVISGKRSAALVAALLGILIRGAIYSVIDPGWPQARRRTLFDRLDPRLAIGFAEGEVETETLPLYELRQVPERSSAPGDVSPESPACIFWTSGSTGEPKAVVAPHRASSRFFGVSSPVPVGPGHSLPSLAAVSWDGFALELWSQLLAGGRLVIHESEYFMPGDLAVAVRMGATDVFLTSGLFDIFVTEDLECFAGMESVWVGGDKLSLDSAAHFLRRYPGISLINMYGPVECGLFLTTYPLRSVEAAKSSVPLGSPNPGSVLAIVESGRIVRGESVGEIWVSGAALALGYYSDAPRTNAVFVGVPEGAPRKFADSRWYRTGDLGRLDADGVVHFHGRADRQIKIGGHRVEPAEVEEAALAAGCSYACVVPRVVNGEVVGVAMATVASESLDQGELRRRLGLTLLPQSVPWPIVLLPALPVTRNGKVDRTLVSQMINTNESAFNNV